MKKLIIYFSALFFVSCKVPKVPAYDPGVSELPGSFGISEQGSSSASLGPLQFFPSPQLRTLIDTVLARNYDLQIATRRIEWARAQAGQSAGFLYPQVNLSAVPSMRRFGLYTMDGAGNIVTDIERNKLVPINLPDLFLGVQTAWEADIWGKLRNRRKAAMARLLATEEGRNLVRTQLVAETASAYYDLLANDQLLRVLEQTITLQEQAIEMVRVQKKAAVVNELAVQQFEAQLLAMKGMRVEVQQQIIDMEARINFLAGGFGRNISRDTAFYAMNTLPELKQGLPADLMRNRPDIRQAEADLIAADADLRAARAAFLPSLNITGTLGVQAYRPGLLFTLPESLAYGFFAGLTAPLLNRAQIKGEFSKAGVLQQEALLNYRKQIARAYSEVYSGLRKITSLEELYEMKMKEADILGSSVQVSTELFRTGRAAYLEVLIARQNTLRANMELIQTRKNQFVAAVDLYRSLGGGWR